MSEITKVTSSHVSRLAIVYVRQSSATQVENNRESTARQYALKQRAEALGWSADRIVVIDDDLGLSGATAHQRTGFARLAAEVALAHVGIVLGLEVSRLARNNTDWYRLLDLCSMTNTLIGDADGVYHPSLFNDRLLLGLKGTMSEAELHVLRARLDGGIRNKAARGELRRGLPIGFVWGEADGEVLLHPDEAVRSAVRAVFERFQEFGSARRVWLWFRSEGLEFPLQIQASAAIRWLRPPISLFTTSFAIRFMRAHTSTASRVESTPSTNTAIVTNALAFYRVISGRCFFVRITKVTSIGPRLKPTRCVWLRTHTLNPTRQEQDH